MFPARFQRSSETESVSSQDSAAVRMRKPDWRRLFRWRFWDESYSPCGPLAPPAVDGGAGVPEAVFRLIVCLAAWGILADRLLTGRMRVADLPELLPGTALLLISFRLPVTSRLDRPLTLTPALAFAVSRWVSPDVAAGGLMFAALLQAQFGNTSRTGRAHLRFYGARLATAIWIAWYGSNWYDSLWRFPSGAAPSADAVELRRIAASAAVGALVFGLSGALLAAVGYARDLLRDWRLPLAVDRFKAAVLLHVLGLLPIVLLSPFDARYGLIVCLPACMLLFLCAQVGRLALDLHLLRGQVASTAGFVGDSFEYDTFEREPERLCQRLLEQAERLVSSRAALVWIYDSESEYLRPIAGRPDLKQFVGRQIRLGRGAVGRAAARGRPCCVRNAAYLDRGASLPVSQDAWLLYPIVAGDRLVGLAQWIRPSFKQFTPKEVASLRLLLQHAAAALDGASVRRLAETDGLTGALNYRRLHDQLRTEIARSHRYGHALSVLMLDIDNFKQLNDTYGHPEGDRLLRQIAAILRSGARTVDYVGRTGGEEFVILLPETSKDAAYGVAERIRCAVEAEAVLRIRDETVRKTVSIGVAAYPEDALSADELLQRADEALYRAKRSGKNCVIWA